MPMGRPVRKKLHCQSSITLLFMYTLQMGAYTCGPWSVIDIDGRSWAFIRAFLGFLPPTRRQCSRPAAAVQGAYIMRVFW
jgi:hypothetical protein